jgi:hypothetical protein
MLSELRACGAVSAYPSVAERPVSCQKSHTGPELVFPYSSGRSSVFADQAVDYAGAFDPATEVEYLRVTRRGCVIADGFGTIPMGCAIRMVVV